MAGIPHQVRERSPTSLAQRKQTSTPAEGPAGTDERASAVAAAEKAIRSAASRAGDILVRELLAVHGTLEHGDEAEVEGALQRALQPVGRCLLEEVWSLQGHDRRPAAPPCCAHCEQPMRLVDSARPRRLSTIYGEGATLPRPYYTWTTCHKGEAPGDAAWHLGPGKLSPALARIVAEAGAHLAFEEAAGMLQRMLGVQVDDNEIERTTESMGLLVDARAALRAETPAPEVPPDPGSDILLMCADGGRVHAGGQWREVKCVAVAALGPETVIDRETGRARLRVGEKRYAATITDSADFFASRVRPLAEDCGLRHPRVSKVVLLADGGPWIEKGWGTLDLPSSVTVVDILDIRHFEEHLHACADAVFGEHTAEAEAWARHWSEAIRKEGPDPLLKAVDELHPQTQEAQEHLRRFRAYIEVNAHRLDYPAFLAQSLPIGSGVVEAEVKVVVNQRAKRSGMRWSEAGAKAVLAFRALVLSAPRHLQAFWDTQPQVNRLPLTLLPGSGRAA